MRINRPSQYGINLSTERKGYKVLGVCLCVCVCVCVCVRIACLVCLYGSVWVCVCGVCMYDNSRFYQMIRLTKCDKLIHNVFFAQKLHSSVEWVDFLEISTMKLELCSESRK